MAAKRQPRYQQVAVVPEEEARKDGNETRELSHLVWMIDDNNA